MDETPQFVSEMNESIWNGFKGDLTDVTPEEAEWHVASLEHGAPMPNDVTPDLQQQIDSVPLDFERNSKRLEELYARFLLVLRRTTLPALQLQTERAYGTSRDGPPIPAHFLGFHQALHLAMHWGQIRTIRNLYKKTRGEPARFYPKNPTYPA